MFECEGDQLSKILSRSVQSICLSILFVEHGFPFSSSPDRHHQQQPWCIRGVSGTPLKMLSFEMDVYLSSSKTTRRRANREKEKFIRGFDERFKTYLPNICRRDRCRWVSFFFFSSSSSSCRSDPPRNNQSLLVDQLLIYWDFFAEHRRRNYLSFSQLPLKMTHFERGFFSSMDARQVGAGNMKKCQLLLRSSSIY